MVKTVIFKLCIPYHDFFKDFIYLFLQHGEGSETDRERNIDVEGKH